jgi:hypothetical protein
MAAQTSPPLRCAVGMPAQQPAIEMPESDRMALDCITATGKGMYEQALQVGSQPGGEMSIERPNFATASDDEIKRYLQGLWQWPNTTETDMERHTRELKDAERE